MRTRGAHLSFPTARALRSVRGEQQARGAFTLFHSTPSSCYGRDSGQPGIGAHPQEVDSQRSSMERPMRELQESANVALLESRAPTPAPHGDTTMSSTGHEEDNEL